MKKEYTTPQIEIVEVAIERGFSESDIEQFEPGGDIF